MRNFRSGRYPKPGVAVFGFCITLLALSCSGGGGGENDSDREFGCSDSPAAADTVALLCGTRVSSSAWQLDLVLGGVTSSADIYGFNFDLVFDPSHFSYVPGSAAAGTLLSQDGDDPLLAAELASDDPGRLIVGIHRTDRPAGVGGPAALNLILRLSLRSDLSDDLDPTLLRFENAEVVDSSGATIGGITFNDQLLLSVK